MLRSQKHGIINHICDHRLDPASGRFSRTAVTSEDIVQSIQWCRVSGFNFKWGKRVMSDLMDTAMIYIGCFGGGVWHGPSNGAGVHADIAAPILHSGH